MPVCTELRRHSLNKLLNKLMNRIRSSIIDTLGAHKDYLLFGLFVTWSLWELRFIMPSCLYCGYWHKFIICLQWSINTRLQLVALPTVASIFPFIQMKIFPLCYCQVSKWAGWWLGRCSSWHGKQYLQRCCSTPVGSLWKLVDGKPTL